MVVSLLLHGLNLLVLDWSLRTLLILACRLPRLRQVLSLLVIDGSLLILVSLRLLLRKILCLIVNHRSPLLLIIVNLRLLRQVLSFLVLDGSLLLLLLLQLLRQAFSLIVHDGLDSNRVCIFEAGIEVLAEIVKLSSVFSEVGVVHLCQVSLSMMGWTVLVFVYLKRELKFW